VGGFFFKAEDGIRDWSVTGVQTCALPIFTSIRRTENVDARRDGRNHWTSGKLASRRSRRDGPSAAAPASVCGFTHAGALPLDRRSEERRVGKECRARGAQGK